MHNDYTNLNQAIIAAMDRYVNRTCFQIKQQGRYHSISYWRFRHLCFGLTQYFRQQNIVGKRIILAAPNSLEWMVTYVAALLAGGVIVPIRTTASIEILHKVIADVEAQVVILNKTDHITAVQNEMQLDQSSVRLLMSLSATSPSQRLNPARPVYVASLNDILTHFATLSRSNEATMRQDAESLPPDTLAGIHYVYSEDGHLTGAVFDHAGRLKSIQSMLAWFPLDEDDVAISIRSWSEVTDLITALYYFLSGTPNVLMESYETLMDDMRQTSPTVMMSIPYGLEQFYQAYMDSMAQQPESSQAVFRWALAKGKEYWAAGNDASPELRQEYARADMTFFSQIRGTIGGRMRRVYVSGASMSPELAEFFEAIGIPLYNLYSLTEAGGFVAISRPGARQLKASGRPAPGYEIKIADDGEILVRSNARMLYYWNQPEQTKHVLDDEGWAYSGDLGYIDADGYLFITERKHHFIVLSTGRKIAPAFLENALTASPLIEHAAIFGDGKPYISAMIAPSLEGLLAYFENNEPDGEAVTTTAHPRVKALIDSIIGDINPRLDDWEQIREYSILDQPLSRDAGELSPSMRIQRHVVAERYAAQIAAMYPIGLQMEMRDVTEVQIEPERLRELLEKESILDAWMTDAGIEFLFALAHSKQIDAPSMVNICDAAATIAQMEHEEKPLSTAFIVGDPAKITRVLPAGQIQLLHHDHIRRMRNILVTLAKMVDGFVLGYVVDKYGYVRGVSRLEVELTDADNILLGPQFRHHAAISKHCDALVFFVPHGGRQVRIFANGQLVGRYANGDWSPENITRVDEIINQLASEHQYHLSIMHRVIRCAFQMSEENLGAIFVLGDASLIMKHSDNSEISSFAVIVSDDINALSDRELINFAKQDGATVIDAQGQFRGCMVLLRPSPDTEAEIGPGKGARHSSAAKMSAEAQCVAITVSQDGPITVYHRGQRVLSM